MHTPKKKKCRASIIFNFQQFFKASFKATPRSCVWVFTAHNLTTIKTSKIILIKLFNSLVRVIEIEKNSMVDNELALNKWLDHYIHDLFKTLRLNFLAGWKWCSPKSCIATQGILFQILPFQVLLCCWFFFSFRIDVCRNKLFAEFCAIQLCGSPS